MSIFALFSAAPGATAYLLLLTGILGLCMGSFCNAWAWRIAHGQSIARGRSRCPRCGHSLSAGDLIPLVSWLCLRGKCRYCGAPISRRYPAVELLGGLYTLSVLLCCGLSWESLRLLIAGSLLLTAALVDLDTMLLPDGLLLAAGGAAFLRLLDGEGTAMLLGGVCIAVPLLLLVLAADRLMGRETMGGGDIKLVAVLGMHFGPLQGLFLLITACVLGLLAGAVMGKRRDAPFPFGPALVLAGWLTVLVGKPVTAWYLSLF